MQATATSSQHILYEKTFSLPLLIIYTDKHYTLYLIIWISMIAVCPFLLPYQQRLEFLEVRVVLGLPYLGALQQIRFSFNPTGLQLTISGPGCRSFDLDLGSGGSSVALMQIRKCQETSPWFHYYFLREECYDWDWQICPFLVHKKVKNRKQRVTRGRRG